MPQWLSYTTLNLEYVISILKRGTLWTLQEELFCLELYRNYFCKVQVCCMYCHLIFSRKKSKYVKINIIQMMMFRTRHIGYRLKRIFFESDTRKSPSVSWKAKISLQFGIHAYYWARTSYWFFIQIDYSFN